jgi:hypothetical protein
MGKFGGLSGGCASYFCGILGTGDSDRRRAVRSRLTDGKPRCSRYFGRLNQRSRADRD